MVLVAVAATQRLHRSTIHPHVVTELTRHWANEATTCSHRGGSSRKNPGGDWQAEKELRGRQAPDKEQRERGVLGFFTVFYCNWTVFLDPPGCFLGTVNLELQIQHGVHHATTRDATSTNHWGERKRFCHG